MGNFLKTSKDTVNHGYAIILRHRATPVLWTDSLTARGKNNKWYK